MSKVLKYFHDNIDKYPYSLNALYRSLGISKQSVHKRLKAMDKRSEISEYVRFIVAQVRKEHPTMGIRDIYFKMHPKGIGRDCFEQMCKELNLMVPRPRNYTRTTDSSGVIRFDNLIDGLIPNRINQVWQSDITYFEVNGKFDYITFIVDSFSRRIVGYSVSDRLSAVETVIPALNQAMACRKGMNLDGLIFHSDGGGQYYSKEFLKLTQKLSFRNSMCTCAWENGKAERINGTIKNNYLIHWEIKNLNELRKMVNKAVSLYNKEKPHARLNRLTPIGFENLYLCNLNSQGCPMS